MVHALRTEDPLIDLRIFRDRVVAASAATTLLFGAAFFGSLLLLALSFQLAHGLSALEAGLVLGVQGVGAMLTMPVAGKLTDRSGAGPVVLAGVALVVLGTVPFALDAPGWLLTLGLALRGVGMGATLMPAMAAGYAALPAEAVARAASALEIVQRVGALLGIALLAVVFQHGLTAARVRRRARHAGERPARAARGGGRHDLHVGADPDRAGAAARRWRSRG